MTWELALVQALNGLQYGVLLFLLAAGLTLVLGIMNFVNLAHASLYMLGAYFGAAVFASTGSFLVASVAAVVGTLIVGLIVERTTLLAFYARDHLDQVLATFGLILFFNELVRVIWGPQSVYMRAPDGFTGTVSIFGALYPSYRFLVIVAGLVVIVIGGIGSIRGAFYGALIVGVVDTVGRIYLPLLLRQVAERSIADAAGPALASMLIFLFMAVVLAFRPQGLFPARK